MLSCDEVEEQLPAYALGILSADERAAIDEHLATCAKHEDLASFRGVVAALPLAGEEMEPPVGLLDRIHARIGAVDPAPTVPVAITARRAQRWMPAVALAAVLMLVSLVLWRGGFVSFGGGEVERSGTSGAIEGRLAYRANTERGELSLRGLATPPAGRAYQAWVIRPGLAPEPYGMLKVTGNEGHVVIQTPLAAGDTVAVTIEPAGGSAVPTSAPVFALPF